MPASERKQLMDGLRGVLRGDGPGIDLDSPTHWVIVSVREPVPFFRALAKLLPDGAVLYMEGTSIAPYVAGFYERHAATDTVPVARDCISPVPDVFHVVFSPAVVDGLCELAEERANPELFDHIKAYHDGTLIFTYHDAFDGQLRVSGRLPESVILEFSSLMGGTYTQEATKQRDPEQLRRFLWLLENPDKMRVAREPIWKRIWHLITRK
jgi:hypothetical protein